MHVPADFDSDCCICPVGVDGLINGYQRLRGKGCEIKIAGSPFDLVNTLNALRSSKCLPRLEGDWFLAGSGKEGVKIEENGRISR